MTTRMPMEFCQQTENGQRCVLRVGHIGSHDLMPPSAVSVRAIERHEAAVRRINDVTAAALGGGQ